MVKDVGNDDLSRVGEPLGLVCVRAGSGVEGEGGVVGGWAWGECPTNDRPERPNNFEEAGLRMSVTAGKFGV